MKVMWQMNAWTQDACGRSSYTVGLTHRMSSRDDHNRVCHNRRTPSSIRCYIRRRRLWHLRSRCCSRLRMTWCDVAGCSDCGRVLGPWESERVVKRVH
jgi:hypothetical protein